MWRVIQTDRQMDPIGVRDSPRATRLPVNGGWASIRENPELFERDTRGYVR